MRTTILPELATERGQMRMEILRNGGKGTEAQERERLRAAAGEFEAIMVELMLKEMRKNVPESPIFGGNNGREIFQEMLDSQYVKQITDSGGLGLTELLMKDLVRKSEGS